MNRTHRIRHASTVLVGAVIFALSAYAMDRGVTDKGIRYATGGVGETEQQALSESSGGYTFWLTTAAKGTGAFMASVQVRITDSHGEPVFDRTIDGPWLMVALPPGNYRVEATSRGDAGGMPQTQRASFSTSANGQKRVTLYFDQPQ